MLQFILNCKRILRISLGALLVLISVGLLVEAKDKRIVLVQDGKPQAIIVTASDASPAAKLAALELQYHVEKITDAVLPIVTDDQPVESARKILVGENRYTRELGIKSADFESQEYLIRITPEMIILIGRDWQDTEANRNEAGRGTNYYTLQDARHRIDYLNATGRSKGANSEKNTLQLPGLFDDQGTCYATYDFLERYCGVRWYGPSELNMTYIKRDALVIEGDEIRRSPDFKHREGLGGGWPIIKAQWNDPNQDELNLYWRRLRIGGEKWAGNHSFRSYYDRFLKKNPKNPELFERERQDFFAQGWDQGERQYCYTNPDLVEQVAQDARDFFDGKGLKGYQPAMGDYFAVVPMDNANWCKCDKCQAWLEKDKENIRGEHFNSGTASHYLFQFVNAVARKVKQTHPDKYIATLAYHVYAYKPDQFELEPNVSVAPCLQTRNYWAPKIKANEMDFYKEWVKDHDRPIFLWNYYCFPMEPAVINKWHCFPGFNIHTHADQIKMYHDDGVRGVFMCGIGEQVDYYLTMKLFDNASLDTDEILDEFFSRYFGAAAKPMKDFYILIEDTYRNADNYPGEVSRVDKQYHQDKVIAWHYLGTKKRMQKLGSLIEEAKKSASIDIEKKRVALWEKGVWEYMVKGSEEFNQ